MSDTPKTTYETVEGTDPSDDTRHEARTITRTDPDETVYMMTEIEDGVFVQWSTCATCNQRPDGCTCKGGPKMPDFMVKWRDERFERSLRGRKKPQAESPIIRQAALAFLHSEDPEELDLKELADALEVPRDEVEAIPPEQAGRVECHPDCVLGPDRDHHGTLGYRCVDADGKTIPRETRRVGFAEFVEVSDADWREDAPFPGEDEDSDVRQSVDDGLTQALAAAKATKEKDTNDVGF